jgi:hypothetical protein
MSATHAFVGWTIIARGYTTALATVITSHFTFSLCIYGPLRYLFVGIPGKLYIFP